MIARIAFAATFAAALAAQEQKPPKPIDRATHKWTSSQLTVLALTLSDQDLMPLHGSLKAADMRLAKRVRAAVSAVFDAQEWLLVNRDQDEANRLAWIGFGVLTEFRKKTSKPPITAHEIMVRAEKRVAAAAKQRTKDEEWAKAHSLKQVYKVSGQVYPRCRDLKPKDWARLTAQEQAELRGLNQKLARLKAEMGPQPGDQQNLRTHRKVHELALRAVELLDKADKGRVTRKPRADEKKVSTKPVRATGGAPASSKAKSIDKKSAAKSKPQVGKVPAKKPVAASWSNAKIDALIRTVRRVPKLNPRVSNNTLRNLNRLHKQLTVSTRAAAGVTEGRLFKRMSRDANMLLKSYNSAVPHEHRKTIETIGK